MFGECFQFVDKLKTNRVKDWGRNELNRGNSERPERKGKVIGREKGCGTRVGIQVRLKIGDSYSYRISPAWKDPDPNTKLGFMRSITVAGKEYVVVEL